MLIYIFDLSGAEPEQAKAAVMVHQSWHSFETEYPFQAC